MPKARKEQACTISESDAEYVWGIYSKDRSRSNKKRLNNNANAKLKRGELKSSSEKMKFQVGGSIQLQIPKYANSLKNSKETKGILFEYNV